LDRLRQLHAVVAETLFLLTEIKHAARHLKSWMAPRRISTALQFWPAKNRLIRQPLVVIGIIAPWTGAYHGEWGFRELSKLKPVFYRSPLNRLADLYPPYGGKIARLQKMLRFMS
jgi:acyl-CoA reductase-like NAD-dependent aldehyde dehydrogenase